MGPDKPVIITEPAILLVEGKDDQGFFLQLFDRTGVGAIQIIRYGGTSELRDYLKTLPLLPGYERVERIGIIRDADESADNAFKSVCHALANADLPVPPGLAELSTGTPMVAAMIVPPGLSTGCLETLLWQTVEATEAATCATEYVDCAGVSTSGNKRDKARVHAYVAVQKKPGLKIGEAAKAKYWDLDHAAILPVSAFLRKLVG